MAHISAQAQAVLDALASRRCHLTAEEIQRLLPEVSPATVYRSLERLTGLGLIRRVPGDEKRAVYEYSRAPHAHLRCRECGALVDIDVDLTGMLQAAARCIGCIAETSDTVAVGLCADCARRAAAADSEKSTEETGGK